MKNVLVAILALVAVIGFSGCHHHHGRSRDHEPYEVRHGRHPDRHHHKAVPKPAPKPVPKPVHKPVPKPLPKPAPRPVPPKAVPPRR